jgi:type IV secretion system protein VirB9
MIRLACAAAKPILAIALASATLAAPALADSRLVTRHYDSEEVVRINGKLGVQASVAFAEDEQIENVAIGDSASWQVTPNKRANLLFVKPLNARARTNMTVVTDRRTYFFDLVAAPGAAPLYVLRFTYPDEPKPVVEIAAPDMTGENAQANSAPVLETPVDPATLNFAWRQRGKEKLLPSRIYDDGSSTYLTWPAKALLPAMQIRNERGVEGPVNYAVRGDVIVVDGVPDVIILRSGKDSAELRHQGPPRPEPELRPLAQPQAQPAALASAAPAKPASPHSQSKAN